MRAAPILAALLAAVVLSQPAEALDLDRQISQYGHTSWRLQDGAFEGIPHAMTQTADGYLWIGTEAGLLRFDGVRFSPWVAPVGHPLSSTSIYALLGARDGGLWIGTGAGLSYWNGRDLINYPETAGRINAIVEDTRGTIWMVRSRARDTKGPLCSVDGSGVRCFGAADGISFPWAEALIADSAGGLWIGTTTGLCHWSPGSVTPYFPDRLRREGGSTGVEALALAADKSILVGVGQAGPGMGMQTIKGKRWVSYVMPGMDGSSLAVSAILRDRDDGLWIATFASGIYHVQSGKTDRFGESDGLSSDTVTGFYQDAERSIWTISPRGIDRFRALPVTTISKREGLAANAAGSVLASKDGSVWIGDGRSLVSLRDGNLSTIRIADRLPAKSVTALLDDHAGRLWVGLDTGLAVFDHGRFRMVGQDGDKLAGMVTGLAEDTDCNIWALVIGRPQKLFRIRDFKIAEIIESADPVHGAALVADPKRGIWVGHVSGDLIRHRSGAADLRIPSNGSGAVRNITALPDGSLWAAADKGLVRWKNGIRRTLDHSNGLPCAEVYSVIADNAGSLWLYSSCGLVKLPASEVEKWWGRPNAPIAVTLYDVFDGAQPGRTPFAPSAAKGPGGRLWFVNASFVQVVDREYLRPNLRKPPVRIEQVVGDETSYLPVEGLRMPAKTRNLQINYTALSFTVPGKVRFRYKLEGRDEKWQEPTNRRQAYYTDLTPREYRFRVIACNNDGVWNEEGAAFGFIMEAAWYQTLWFRLLTASGVLTGLWCLYRLRIWQLAAALNERFDERMTERNRLAAELHDTFLQTVQASKMIADQALFDQRPDALRLRSAMETVNEWLAKAISEGQATLNALRTSSVWRNDLAESLQHTATVSHITDSLDFVLSVDGKPKEMHPIVRDEVYRIGSEAIRNAQLHSRGTRVEVRITYGRDLTLQIVDDGKGFHRHAAAVNLKGGSGFVEMQERAIRIGARIRLFTRRNAGTELELRVPGNVAFHYLSRGGNSPELRWLERK